MFGKHFASMYSGSLFGKPAIVFAVWGYAISNMRPSRSDGECYVEINPTLLAATFAATVNEVQDALAALESPDPASRTSSDDGRRLILLGPRHSGPMQFRVVNGKAYRAIRDEESRREQNRAAKSRERHRNVSNVSHGQPRSAQVEVEAEVEAVKLPRKRGSRVPEPFYVTDELRSWATAEFPMLDIDGATLEFLDYWRGVPGAKGCKLDWSATWRNSMRGAAERGKHLRRDSGAAFPMKLVPIGAAQ